MKLTCKLFLFSLLFLVNTSFSQAEKSDSAHTKRLEITCSPFTHIITSPRLRVGVAFRPAKNQEIAIDIGYGDSRFALNQTRNDSSDLNEHYQFEEVRISFKQFGDRVNKTASWYYGAELFFKSRTVARYNDYYYPSRINREQITTYDFAKQQDRVFGGLFIGGVKFIALQRLTFDLYGGAGLRMRNVFFSDKKNAEVKDEPESGLAEVFELLDGKRRYEGYSPGPTFVLNFKIGFILAK